MKEMEKWTSKIFVKHEGILASLQLQLQPAPHVLSVSNNIHSLDSKLASNLDSGNLSKNLMKSLWNQW